MMHPVDTEKLDRVRLRLAALNLDALVVRAPDNILYLTDYWCMKATTLPSFRGKAKHLCS